MGLPWDEPFSVRGVGGEDWDRFMQELPRLEAMSLARSFTALGKKVKCIESHVFCDALSDTLWHKVYPMVMELALMFVLYMRTVCDVHLLLVKVGSPH